MSKKVYLYILKGGIFASLISVLLVYGKFLFPYITSKQIYFNILIEVLFVFWVAFLLKFPEFRPKKSWITRGLGLYLLVILFSCFNSVDFNLSFWGDVERMLGFFHVFHFYIFYLIVISVFREKKDWKILFSLSLVLASIVSIKALVGEKESTIGNSAYVAGYLIFNVYFSILLFIKGKDKVFRWLYLLPLFVFLPAFFKADSSGGFVGLGFSLLCLLFFYGVLNKNKKVKRATFASFLLFLLGIVFIFSVRFKEPFVDYKILNPARGISLEKNTFQTRLISWKAAIKAFPEHPLLGTGFGNYAIIFDKYFEPIFYTYTSSETFFDRAHNNLIDILATTGISGFATYCVFIISAFYYLIISYRSGKIDIHNFILPSCLLIGYLVQNLAVFDSLVTYISLMMILGYIYYLHNEKLDVEDIKEGELSYEWIAIFLLSVLSLLVVYQFNYKPAKMLINTIETSGLLNQGKYEEALKKSKETFEKNGVLDRDGRSHVVNMFASSASRTGLKNLSPEKRKEIVNYMIELSQRNIDLNPLDTIANTQIAKLYNLSISLVGDVNLANSYINKAFYHINQAIESSPERVQIFLIKAEILLNAGKVDEAVAILEQGLELNPDYSSTTCYLGKIYLSKREQDKAYKYIDKCVDLNGLQVYSYDFLMDLKDHYGASSSDVKTEKENKKRLIKIYTSLAGLNKDYNFYIELAKLYKEAGNNEKAIESARQAAQLNPSLQDAVDQFINEINN